MSPNATSTSHRSPPARAEPARRPGPARRAPLALLGPAVLALAGCAQGSFDAALDRAVKGLFKPRRTPQQELLLAVSSEDPDARRDAVARIAASKDYNRDWAIKGYVAIALLESNAQTRCVAIRALARTGDPRAVETALKILNYEDYPAQEVWPPLPICRWDAAEALADLSARRAVPETYRPAVLETLRKTLRTDSERHARIAAARGLGCYPDESAVDALVRGLRDADFAVVHQCEDALVRLTGHTHDCDPAAWNEWVAAHRENLFADAGYVPESRRPPYANGWEKAAYETKEFLIWLWPGTKE